MAPADWDRVRAIYEQGIATGNATFETEAPPWSAWDGSHLPDHRLVAIADDVVVGWAALSQVSDRCVYAGVAENSAYVATEARGRGVGRVLLGSLIAGAEAAGIWTIQTGIFPEKSASIHLHQSCGSESSARESASASSTACGATHSSSSGGVPASAAGRPHTTDDSRIGRCRPELVCGRCRREAAREEAD